MGVTLLLTAPWTPLTAQSIASPEAPKSSLPSDASGLLEALRTTWGLHVPDLAKDQVEYSRVGDRLGRSGTSGNALERELLAGIALAGKLVSDEPTRPDTSIKKAMALADQGVRSAVEGLATGNTDARAARRDVRNTLSDYLAALGGWVDEAPPRTKPRT